MFRKTLRQEKQPWTTLIFASAALCLAVYYLRPQYCPSATEAKSLQVTRHSCQDDDEEADRAPNNMSAQERVYHQRFMREAIAMVRRSLYVSFT